jgi:hypothetical protein
MIDSLVAEYGPPIIPPTATVSAHITGAIEHSEAD